MEEGVSTSYAEPRGAPLTPAEPRGAKIVTRGAPRTQKNYPRGPADPNKAPAEHRRPKISTAERRIPTYDNI